MNFFSSLNIPPINEADALSRVENSPFQRLNLQHTGESEPKEPDEWTPESDDEPNFSVELEEIVKISEEDEEADGEEVE